MSSPVVTAAPLPAPTASAATPPRPRPSSVRRSRGRRDSAAFRKLLTDDLHSYLDVLQNHQAELTRVVAEQTARIDALKLENRALRARERALRRSAVRNSQRGGADGALARDKRTTPRGAVERFAAALRRVAAVVSEPLAAGALTALFVDAASVPPTLK